MNHPIFHWEDTSWNILYKDQNVINLQNDYCACGMLSVYSH